MAWDNDKSTAQDPDNPQADEQLTADEWDNHVSQGHFPSDELNFGVDGNGDPVITDPQNGGQTVMRYDRSAGSWVVEALEAENANITNETLIVVGLNSSSSSISAGTWATPDFDSPIKDERGEFSNNQFTPTEDGFYNISAQIRASPGASGDDLEIRLRDVSNSNDVYQAPNKITPSAQNQKFPDLNAQVELSGGNNYEIQVRDKTSSYGVSEFFSRLSIRGSFR